MYSYQPLLPTKLGNSGMHPVGCPVKYTILSRFNFIKAKDTHTKYLREWLSTIIDMVLSVQVRYY